jgi:hypothetical protein
MDSNKVHFSFPFSSPFLSHSHSSPSSLIPLSPSLGLTDPQGRDPAKLLLAVALSAHLCPVIGLQGVTFLSTLDRIGSRPHVKSFTAITLRSFLPPARETDTGYLFPSLCKALTPPFVVVHCKTMFWVAFGCGCGD